jgi:DNA-binding NarL/FixJ family response regulator
MLRILLVDGHDFFRSGLRRLLVEHGMKDIHDLASGEEAVAQVSELAPRRRDHGPQHARDVRHRVDAADRRGGSRARVLVLTVTDDDVVMEAISAGADGYLLKSASPEQIIEGVKAASQGESPISPRIAARIVDRTRAAGGARSPPGAVRRAVGARNRGPAARQRGAGERSDRTGPVHQSADRGEPHRQHPGEAPHAEPHPGGAFAARSGLLDQAND